MNLRDALTRAEAEVSSTGPLHYLLQQIVRALNGAGKGSSSPLVYRPGGPSSSNVFADWNALYAQLPEYAPVVVDSSLAPGGQAVLPAGAYPKVRTLVGVLDQRLPDNPKTQLLLADGVTMPNLSNVANNLYVTTASTQPILTMGAEGVFVVERGAAIDAQAGAAPMIDVAPGLTKNATVVGLLGGIIGASPGAHVVNVGLRGAGVIVFLLDIATLGTDVLTGPGAATVLYGAETALLNTDGPPPPQPSLGTYSGLSFTQSSNVIDWSATALGSVAVPTFFFPAGLTTIDSGVSVTALRPAVVSHMSLRHVGDPANPAGSSILYELFANGAAVPGASFSLPAVAGIQNAGIDFFSGWSFGAGIQLRATPQGGVVVSPTNITVAVS